MGKKFEESSRRFLDESEYRGMSRMSIYECWYLTERWRVGVWRVVSLCSVAVADGWKGSSREFSGSMRE